MLGLVWPVRFQSTLTVQAVPPSGIVQEEGAVKVAEDGGLAQVVPFQLLPEAQVVVTSRVTRTTLPPGSKTGPGPIAQTVPFQDEPEAQLAAALALVRFVESDCKTKFCAPYDTAYDTLPDDPLTPGTQSGAGVLLL